MASTELIERPSPANAFLLLHEKDNILVCAQFTRAGEIIDIDGRFITLSSDINVGHKIARDQLRTGHKVLRYGMAIGTMIADAAPGEHVHSHNLKSDYISAHTRDQSSGPEIRS